MIVTRTLEILGSQQLHEYRTKDVTLRWSGTMYIPGFSAGEESARHLVEEWTTTGSLPFQSLRGSFTIFAEFAGCTIAFTDNSGLHALYVHEEAVSNSLLQLVSHLRSKRIPLDFNLSALAQSFAVGRILTDETQIHGVHMVDKYDFLEINGATIRSFPKHVPDIDSHQEKFSASEFFDSACVALEASQPISCALTGGYDSRMVLAFMQKPLSALATLSGDRRDTKEARAAGVTAQAAGLELTYLMTPKPRIDTTLLKEAFVTYDGMPGFLADSAFRLTDFYRQLAERDVTLHLTGDGGVLHKDWEWIQDFPFYNRKTLNFKKFYRQRLAFNFDRAGAGSSLDAELEGLADRLISWCRTFQRRTNTQTYDLLYYHINGRRSALYNSAPSSVALYAPLLERDFVSYSYHLPRRQRFFNNSIRKMTTAQNRQVARVPTVYGTTSSSEFRFVCRDVFFQFFDYGRRFIRMAYRRAFGRTPLLESPTTWSLDNDFRELPFTGSAVAYCQRTGLIDTSQSVSSLSRRHLEFAIETMLLGEHAGICEPSGIHDSL